VPEYRTIMAGGFRECSAERESGATVSGLTV